jgi:uncharacterized protein (TIGR02996 family)
MKNQEQAFLEAILERPDDDAPRLIFADWLDEHGDTDRAEFIRVQCAIAAKDLPTSRRAKFDRRQQELLERHGSEWAHPLRPLVLSWNFHRGFIDEIVVYNDLFLVAAEQIFRRAPIRHLKIQLDPHGIARPIAALAESEHLGRLRSLNLSGNRLESRHVRALVVSEHLSRLTDLDLSHNRIGDGGIRALAASPLLSRLERLILHGNDIGPTGMRALGRSILKWSHSAQGLRLRLVDLQHNNLSAAGQRVVADSPLLRRLVRV